MAKTEFEALSPPPKALQHGGKEILRAAIVDGGLHVSIVRGFESVDVWGILLVDLARHAARIFARETGVAEDEAVSKIDRMYRREMDTPTDRGTTDSFQ